MYACMTNQAYQLFQERKGQEEKGCNILYFIHQY